MTWHELGDGVFTRRWEFLQLNTGAMIGDDGVLLVDTRASHREAGELAGELRRITGRPVRWVVNTHHHWDHCFGNAVFPDARRWGHPFCRARLLETGEAQRREALAWVGPDRRDEILEVEIVPPNRLVAESAAIDLGGLAAELLHLGRGHTAGDVVVTAGDVVFAGDLIEESAPPMFGDAFPFEWPGAVATLRDVDASVFVPGHGRPVDRRFVAGQLDELRAVAELGRRCREDALTVAEAAAQGPYPAETIRVAIDRVTSGDGL